MDSEYWEKMNPRFVTPRHTDPLKAVPAELKQLRQWVLWHSEVRNGKQTKVPYQVSEQKAKANTPKTWTDYQTALQHVHKGDGIGFVFSGDDPYCGIDLDNCIDENRELKAWANPIMEKFKAVSYGEVSPSGKGIKIWTRACLPATGYKHKVYIASGADAIEVYDKTRFFTVTGRGKGQICEGQAAVDWLLQAFFKAGTPKSTRRLPAHTTTEPPRSVSEIIELINESKQCQKFEALMRGDLSGYGSHSEADMALCSVIVFWTQDTHTIDAIFRESALYRQKWDEKHRGDGATYGEMTIEKALAERTDSYTPRKNKRDPILSIAYTILRKRRF